MEGDLIFVNIDPVFNIALEAVEELGGQGRLEEINRQESWLHAIQSDVDGDDDDGDDNIFKFGEETQRQHALAFGRTASAVFRMVMLHGVQIKKEKWPSLGKNTKKRNREALQFKVSEQFKNKEALQLLGENPTKKTVKQYYEKYDQVFPPSLISRKLLTNKGRNVPFHNKMLIFRNNFGEVIIIETTANARMYPSPKWGWKSKREFDSDVKVTCTRKTIKRDKDGEYFKKLKALPPGAGQEQAQPMTRDRKKVLNQLKADMELNKLPNEMEHLRTTDSSGGESLPATDPGDNEPEADSDDELATDSGNESTADKQ